MLQIRLSKGSSASDAGGGSAGDAATGSAAPPVPLSAAAEGEGVTVACPDHLVIADLPVAKSLGAVTSTALATGHYVGRRSRRPLGRRVHICSRCDFPVAIYGRLDPCKHAFCLTCARSEGSCFLCEERIQKIQSIRMMDGIFICAAPQCLKSFVKKEDFESHINDSHSNLMQTNGENASMHETDAPNNSRLSKEDSQRQSQMPEISTARGPQRSGPSPTSSSQYQDRDDRSRHHQSRDQILSKPNSTSSKPLLHHGRQPVDSQPDNSVPPGFEKSYNWAAQSPGMENLGGSQQIRRESSQFAQDKLAAASDSSFHPQLQQQQTNFAVPMNINPAFVPNPALGYAINPDGSQQYFVAPFQMQLPDVGSEQVSLLGMPPPPVSMAGVEGFPRPWGMGLVNIPFPQMPIAQGPAEGVVNPIDPQVVGLQFAPPGFGMLPDGSSISLNTSGANQSEGKGLVPPHQFQMPISMSHPPPPPPLPPSAMQQQQHHVFSRTKYAAGSSSNE